MMASQVALLVKNSTANAGDIRYRDLSLGQDEPLEEEIATHSSILAWEVSWTEEPMGYSPWGRRVRHD